MGLIAALASTYRRHIRRIALGATPPVGIIVILDVPEFPRNVFVDMHKVTA